jgi:2-iminobutanoate/2-iminopropanoate deaminase
MRAVSTRRAPLPAGHYAQAIVHGGVVYVAGQLPIDPQAVEQRMGSVEEQTERALRNLGVILEAAGSNLDRVLKTTVYVTDIRLWDRVNAVYARVFGQHRPARTVVPVSELHHGVLVEIEAVAALEGRE